VAQRIPRWESELWSYISSGDGVHCPLYGYCQARQREGWCLADYVGYVNQLVDANCSNLSDYASTAKSCRIFKLIEMLALRCLKKGQVDYPPVPTELVSLADEQCAIEVRLVPLTAYHGGIWHLNGTWIIQLNKNDSSPIRRFTLFHEAFHILAHRRASPVFRKRGLETGCFNELLAEQFAIFTLMPSKMVRRKWAEVNDLTKMTEIFDVPESVVWFRLKSLHLI